MSIEPGQTLLHYRLTEKLGEGGMGVVWKATDSTLGREVAIKILPPDFAADEERLARFEREARLLASLNHPNIAGIYGIHNDKDTHFLAMELVSGEDLSERLQRAALPVEQALRAALEIAAGLEAAHENGVIHRDLKPANVKLTREGQAKVLDFGLAKAADAAAPPGSDPSLSPTMTSAGTQLGMILGTASYMSPEQAAGQPVDRRCDIWAFGVLLHELLTGKRMFEGATISHTLAAVLRDEIDLSDLPAGTPRSVRQLLGRCLERDPARRLRDIGEARILLEDLQGGRIEEAEPVDVASPAASPPGSRLPWLVAAIAVTGLLILAGLQFGRSSSTTAHVPEPLHVDLAPPEGTHYDLHHGSMAVSPDGRSIAFIAQDEEGSRHLWVRNLRESSALRLKGTEGAQMPFWSPDGVHLGFVAQDLLKRVPARGGPVDGVTAEPLDIHGATWTPDEEILVGAGENSVGLSRVNASGGTAEPIIRLKPGAVWESYPHPIPGTDAMLMTERRGQVNTVMILERGGELRELMPGDSNVVYVEPGFVLFWRDGGLRAQPFDKHRLELTGEPRLVAPGVAIDPSNLSAHFSAAGGTLAYIKGAEADSQSRLVLRNRAGEEIGTVGPHGNYYSPSFSPDGQRVAVDQSGNANNGDIWIHDLDRPVGTRVTRHPADESSPVWSPDGKQIVFWSAAQGGGDLFLHRVGESVVPTYLMGEAGLYEEPDDWSPDGRTIALLVGLGITGEIRFYDVGSGETRAMQSGVTEHGDPQFSPDGKFLAYTSIETGRDEIFLRALEPGGRAWQVSLEGGDGPHWRADGRELFFYGADGFIHVVEIDLVDEVTIGNSRPLFRARMRFEDGSHFDVSPDGESFVINSWVEDESRRAMSVVLDWTP